MKEYFSSIEMMGMIFQAGKAANASITQTFRRVTLDSILPTAAYASSNEPEGQSGLAVRRALLVIS